MCKAASRALVWLPELSCSPLFLPTFVSLNSSLQLSSGSQTKALDAALHMSQAAVNISVIDDTAVDFPSYFCFVEFIIANRKLRSIVSLRLLKGAY
jgi:hypothetical protein